MARKALSRTQKILSFKEKIAVEAELHHDGTAGTPVPEAPAMAKAVREPDAPLP